MSEGPQALQPTRLKNENPPIGFRVTPRCGAKTRFGASCQGPAMRNGRCRMHGGPSTGPRTPDGLERCRMANLKHGLRSAEMITLRRQAKAARRTLNELIARASARSDLNPFAS